MSKFQPVVKTRRVASLFLATGEADPEAVRLKEIRFVLFDFEEVRVAVVEFLSKRTNMRINAEIAKVELGQGDDGPFGKVHFRSAANQEARALRTGDLLDAVLSYCAKRRVPLPMRGIKTLEITEDNLVLSIRKF